MTATPPTDALSARKGKVKKQQRAEALRKEKERVSRLREAAHKRDLLDEYPAFKRFDRQGLEVTLESAHGAELSEADTDACIALQRQNIAQLSQTETWNEDTARSALGHPESRMLLLRGTVLPGAVSASTSTPMSALDEWVVVPSASELEYETPPPTAPRSQPTVLGYLHLQFCIGDNANPTAQPLLCVLNMQLAPPVMGKGLGKFALQFVELIARRNGLELVMLYIKDGAVKTMSLTHAHSKCATSPATALAKALAHRNHDGQRDGSALRPDSTGTASQGAVMGEDDDDDPFELVDAPEAVMLGGRVPIVTVR